MTAAPRDPGHPLRRVVRVAGERRILEVTEETMALRYPRARQPHVVVTWGQLEQRALLAQPPRRRGRRAA